MQTQQVQTSQLKTLSMQLKL